MDGNFPGTIWSPASWASTGAREQTQTLTTLLGPTMVPDTNPRRQIYPREQWQTLKPIIQQMYIDEGQTFKQVAEYLHEHHDFNPTKKQFNRRISQWGLEKNVKQDERRAILENIGPQTQDGEFEARMLRGRRLDKAKLDRWRKREGIGGGNFQTRLAQSGILGETSSLRDRNSSLSSEVELCNQDDTPENLPRQGGQLGPMPMDQEPTFNPWLLADVIGSPRFTRLIGALTIDLCEDIPNLDLSAPNSEESEDPCDLVALLERGGSSVCHKAQNQPPTPKIACHSVSFSIAALLDYFAKQSKRWMPGPLDELDPFPRSVQPSKIFIRAKTDHLVSDYSLRMQELKCKRKFKKLKSMEPREIIDLAEDMDSIAFRHYELDQYRLAEVWWRRVITLYSMMPGHRSFKILYACLNVVDAVWLQSRYREVLSLHQSMHHKILKLVEPEHELAIRSRKHLVDLRYVFGVYEPELAILRELLQICLLRLGIRSRDTLSILVNLGTAQIVYGQFREAETVLSIQVQVDCEISSYSGRNSLLAMGSLAQSLNSQRRYEESKCVLGTAERWFKDTIRIENPFSWRHFREKARVLKCQGELLESEEILRAILRHEPDYLDWGFVKAMEQLDELLIETGQGQERAILREKIFLMETEMYGIEHCFSKSSCKKLGFCYAELGRYDDAIFHFQQTIEMLTVSNEGDLESRDAYIEDIRGWISKVEEMKIGAQTTLNYQPMTNDTQESSVS